MGICIHMYIQKPETDIRNHILLLSTLFTGAGSVAESEIINSG